MSGSIPLFFCWLPADGHQWPFKRVCIYISALSLRLNIILLADVYDAHHQRDNGSVLVPDRRLILELITEKHVCFNEFKKDLEILIHVSLVNVSYL